LNNKILKGGYLDGSIVKLLFTKSLPMVVGIGAAMSFAFVDTYWVGKLGTNPLAAMTFTFPLDFLVMGLAFGVGTGASAEISKAFGRGDLEKVRTLTRETLILSFVIVAICVSTLYLFMDNIFVLMGAKPELIPLIKEFMKFWIPGQFALVIPIIINSATRAIGDTKTPSFIMLGAGVINLIINPLFIFGWYGFPEFGIAGSSLSTLISRLFTLVVAFYLITYRDKMLSFKIPTNKEFFENVSSILKVGLPSMATQLIMPLGISIVIKFVSIYGNYAVAAFGMASRIDTTALVVFMAMASVVGPFVGQNLGAKRFDRIKELVKNSYYFAFIWGFVMVIIFNLFGEAISKAVKDDVNVVNIMVAYLSITSFSIAFRGISMLNTTALNVLQQPITSALLTSSQIFVFFIPFAFLLSSYIGLNGIFWANLFSGLVISIISYFILKKSIAKLETQSLQNNGEYI